MYLQAVGLSSHDFGCHGGDGAEGGLLELVLLDDLFGKAHICDLIDSIVREYVFGLEVAMDDLVAVEFLDINILTAMPLMICFRTSIAYFSGMRSFWLISS